MIFTDMFRSIFRRKPAPAEPKRSRTKPHLIESAILHEIAAGNGSVTVEMVCDRHPDFLRASVVATFLRLVKSGELVKVVDGTYRKPESKPELRAVESGHA